MPTIPSHVDINEVVRLYETGLTREEVGRQFNVSGTTIMRWMNIAGYERSRGQRIRQTYERRFRASVPDLTSFFERYSTGEPLYKLAGEAGINKHRFKQLLIEAGHTIRSQPEALREIYATMSADERARFTEIANITKRSMPASHRSLTLAAIAREKSLSCTSRTELILAVWLAQRGIEFTLQKAVDVYNIDIAIHEPTIAVEVIGLSGTNTSVPSGFCSTAHSRRQYLLNCGWRMIEVRTDRSQLATACANRIVTLLEEARSDEPSWGQYCVIGGDGESLTSSED